MTADHSCQLRARACAKDAEDRLHDLRDLIADDVFAGHYPSQEAYRSKLLTLVKLTIAEMEDAKH